LAVLVQRQRCIAIKTKHIKTEAIRRFAEMVFMKHSFTAMNGVTAVMLLLIMLIAGCSEPAAVVQPPSVEPMAENDQMPVSSNMPAIPGDSAPEMIVVPEGQDTDLQDVPQVSLKEFTMTARQWEFSPNEIRVNKGDRVRISVTSSDVAHGFRLPEFSIDERLPPGKEVIIEFVADKAGTFPFSCSVPCGSGHGSMTGLLIVE